MWDWWMEEMPIIVSGDKGGKYVRSMDGRKQNCFRKWF